MPWTPRTTTDRCQCAGIKDLATIRAIVNPDVDRIVDIVHEGCGKSFASRAEAIGMCRCPPGRDKPGGNPHYPGCVQFGPWRRQRQAAVARTLTEAELRSSHPSPGEVISSPQAIYLGHTKTGSTYKVSK